MICSGRYNRRLGKRQGVHGCSRPCCICLHHSLQGGWVSCFRSGMSYCLAPAWPPTAGSLVRSRQSSSDTVLLPPGAYEYCAVTLCRDVVIGINMSLGHVSTAVAEHLSYQSGRSHARQRWSYPVVRGGVDRLSRGASKWLAAAALAGKVRPELSVCVTQHVQEWESKHRCWVHDALDA